MILPDSEAEAFQKSTLFIPILFEVILIIPLFMNAKMRPNYYN